MHQLIKLSLGGVFADDFEPDLDIGLVLEQVLKLTLFLSGHTIIKGILLFLAERDFAQLIRNAGNQVLHLLIAGLYVARLVRIISRQCLFCSFVVFDK